MLPSSVVAFEVVGRPDGAAWAHARIRQSRLVGLPAAGVAGLESGMSNTMIERAAKGLARAFRRSRLCVGGRPVAVRAL